MQSPFASIFARLESSEFSFSCVWEYGGCPQVCRRAEGRELRPVGTAGSALPLACPVTTDKASPPFSGPTSRHSGCSLSCPGSYLPWFFSMLLSQPDSLPPCRRKPAGPGAGPTRTLHTSQSLWPWLHSPHCPTYLHAGLWDSATGRWPALGALHLPTFMFFLIT